VIADVVVAVVPVWVLRAGMWLPLRFNSIRSLVVRKRKGWLVLRLVQILDKQLNHRRLVVR